jgi:transportin-3
MNVLLGAIFASAIADMLMDAAAVLGGQETLRLLAQPLLQSVSGAGIGGSWDWCTAEASLYCIRAIAKAVPSSEDVLLPQVMALLPQLPSHPQLVYTCEYFSPTFIILLSIEFFESKQNMQ